MRLIAKIQKRSYLQNDTQLCTLTWDEREIKKFGYSHIICGIWIIFYAKKLVISS